MQADSDQRSQPNGRIGNAISDIGVTESVDKMKRQIAPQQIQGCLLVHVKGMRNDMEKGHRDQHTCRETGKIGGIELSPCSKSANDIETCGRDPGREKTGQDGISVMCIRHEIGSLLGGLWKDICQHPAGMKN